MRKAYHPWLVYFAVLVNSWICLMELRANIHKMSLWLSLLDSNDDYRCDDALAGRTKTQQYYVVQSLTSATYMVSITNCKRTTLQLIWWSVMRFSPTRATIWFEWVTLTCNLHLDNPMGYQCRAVWCKMIWGIAMSLTHLHPSYLGSSVFDSSVILYHHHCVWESHALVVIDLQPQQQSFATIDYHWKRCNVDSL